MSILNEAILDAKLIRESAKKVALNSLKEKYSDEYRKNFKSSLFKNLNEAPFTPPKDPNEEQAEEDFNLDDLGNEEQANAEMGANPDLAMGGGDESTNVGDMQTGTENPEDKAITDAIPHAFKDKQDTSCACPADDQEITIDLGDLGKSLNDEVMNNLGDSPVDRESFAQNMDGELPVNQLGDEEEEEEDRYELNRESLDRFLSLEDGFKTKINELSLRNKFLTEKIRELGDTNSNLSERLDKTNLELKKSSSMNLKLVYKNKVLADASLNERQKRSMLESIEKIKNSEAEMLPSVYEMLKEAIGGAGKKPARNESLFEIANGRGNNHFVGKPDEVTEHSKADESFKRWQQLARIIKE